jgi:DNA-binding NtrC family response regulator
LPVSIDHLSPVKITFFAVIKTHYHSLLHIRILYAEDEPTLREITWELLMTEGHEGKAVEDGVYAMEALQTEHFDIVITDFRMPRMDGPQSLMWCRKNNLHMPFIFITATDTLLPIEKTASMDCCTIVLQKPVSFENLIKAIDDGRKRNHFFQCKGKAFKTDGAGPVKDFPGIHYI